MDESVDWPKTLEGGSKKYEMGMSLFMERNIFQDRHKCPGQELLFSC